MKNRESHLERAKRRFNKKVDGEMVRRLFHLMPTAELARMMGLTVKQIENYVYRHNTEPWARKMPSVVSEVSSAKGKKGGRPRK